MNQLEPKLTSLQNKACNALARLNQEGSITLSDFEYVATAVVRPSSNCYIKGTVNGEEFFIYDDEMELIHSNGYTSFEMQDYDSEELLVEDYIGVIKDRAAKGLTRG